MEIQEGEQGGAWVRGVTAAGDLLCARKNRGRGYTMSTVDSNQAKRSLIDAPGSHAGGASDRAKKQPRVGSGHSRKDSGSGLLVVADDDADAVSFLNHEREAASRPVSAVDN